MFCLRPKTPLIGHADADADADAAAITGRMKNMQPWIDLFFD